jgi:hypothetical protein
METKDLNQLNTESGNVTIDADKLLRFNERLHMEQNLPLGILAGLVAALVGAILWAVITVATQFQIGYMAVAIGLMVGFSVRFAGKGMDQPFGISGAVLAFLGCVLGNWLSTVGFIAEAEAMSYVDVLFGIDYSLFPTIMAETFSPMDILFYGLAIYEGYKFSFREVTEEEVLAQAGVRQP